MGDRNSKEEILKIFNLFDIDNNNGISFQNLKQIAEEMGKNLKPISSSTVKLSSNTAVSKKTSKPKRKGKPVKVKRRTSTNSP